MSNSETVAYKFTVKEGSPIATGGNAPVFLAMEPLDGRLSIVGDGMLTLRLADDATTDQAAKVAAYLNIHIKGIKYSR